MKQNTKLKIYVVLLPVVGVLVWGAQVVTGALMSRESAAFLSSFSVVTTIVAFIAFLCTFILTGTLILVGHADAKGHYEQVGKLIVWSSAAGFAVGCISSLYVVLDSDTLINVFDPNGELVPETELTLYVFAIGFPPLVYCYGLAGGLFSLLLLGPVVAGLGVVAFVFIGLSYPLFFAGVGLPSFGIGFNAGAIVFAVLMSVYLYGNRERRKRYQFPCCSPEPSEVREESNYSESLDVKDETTVRQILCEFIKSFGMLSVRSLLVNLQKLLSVLLLVRIGVVPAAVYVLLGNLRAISGNLMTICTFVINFVGSRVYGAGDAEHVEADFRGFLAVSKFSAIFVILLGIVLGLTYGVLGKGIVLRQAADDEVEEYEELLSVPLILIFCFIQTAAPVAGVHEAILMTAKDFNFIGFEVLISFLFGYLPLLLIGYGEGSLTLIYAGDFLFFLMRALFTCIRWYFFLKKGLVERTEKLISRKGSRSRKEKAVHWVCCGHELEDWNAIVSALTREEKPKSPERNSL